MHGSEANEHIFGLLRSLIPDFTMLNVLRMIPKLNVWLMAACKAKNVQVRFQHTAAGYSHTYFDANDIPLGVLSEFPSNSEISQAATIAYDEAITLWDLLGYYHTGGGNSATPSHGGPNQAVSDPNKDADHLGELEDNTSQAVNRHALQEALDSTKNISGLDDHAHTCLNEYSYAAACLNFVDQEKV